MERLLSAPPLTRAQLGLLRDGVIGELAQTRALLGREPQPLTTSRIAALARAIGPWLGVSLRLVARAEDRRFLASCAAAAPRLLLFVPLAALLITGLRAVTGDIWRCMAIANLILIPTALLGLGLPWRALLRPRLWHMVFGTGAALALFGLGWRGDAGLARAGAGADGAADGALWLGHAAAGRAGAAGAGAGGRRRGAVVAARGWPCRWRGASGRGGAAWRRRWRSRWRTCTSGRRCCGWRRSAAGWRGRGWR
jgi:hypothetical protein